MPPTRHKRPRDLDDEAIAYYGRKLGLKKGGRSKDKSKGRALGDGLDELLDGLEEGDEDEEQEGHDDDEDDEGTPDSDVSSPAQPPPDVSPVPVQSKQAGIYGENKVDVARYIPPAQRKLDALPSSSDRTRRLAQLRPKVNGLLNRLGESNISTVFLDVTKLYQDYPRNDVSSTVTALLIENVSSKVHLLSAFLSLQAALATALYRTLGVDFGARCLQEVVMALLESLQRAHVVDEHRSSNLLRVVCEFRALGMISSRVLFDLIELFSAKMDEASLDGLLTIYQAVGPELRQDNASEFKKGVLEIQSKAHDQDGSRAKFLMECISSIKVKKHRSETGKESDLRATLRNWLLALGKTQRIVSREPLDPSLDQIRRSAETGPWWLQRDMEAVSASAARTEPQDQTVTEVSKKLGLNTALRVKIFSLLTSGQDVEEAGRAMEHMRLRPGQEREVIRVILRCVSMERSYNPYYEQLIRFLLLSKTKSKSAHGHRITLMYSFWDILRAMGEREVGGLDLLDKGELETGELFKTSRRARRNLAQLYGRLIGRGGERGEDALEPHQGQSLSLAILKPLPFDRLQESTTSFVQTLMVHVFLASHASDPALTALGALFAQEARKSRVVGLGLLLFLCNEMKWDALERTMDMGDLYEQEGVETLGKIIRDSTEAAKNALKSALRGG